MIKKPRNFSFIDESLAGLAKPLHIEEIDFLKNSGISKIFSLTPQLPLVSKYTNRNEIEFIHLPTFTTPNEKHIHLFFEMVSQALQGNTKIAVHCEFGEERTGMYLALYLTKFKNNSMKEAIEIIQNLRPGSLRTSSSLDFLDSFQL